ncbi:gelsolin repeat protein, partial [Ostertagia ostertagi]
NLPPWYTVTRVLESAEPASFTQWFDEWVDTKTTKTFVPHLFQVSDKTGGMNVEEIANYIRERKQGDSLDGDDVMILDALNRIYVWVGEGANPSEKTNAVHTAEATQQNRLKVVTIFDREIENISDPTARNSLRFDEWVDTKTTKTFVPHLFQVSDKTGGMNVEEIANYNQESLDGDDVMILDALNRIYVWVGEGANPSEKTNASLDGDDVMILDALNRIYVWVGEGANPSEKTNAKYLKIGKLPRHEKTTIETIYQGKETPGFKSLFPKWDDKLFRSVSVYIVLGERSVQNMRKLLFN